VGFISSLSAKFVQQFKTIAVLASGTSSGAAVRKRRIFSAAFFRAAGFLLSPAQGRVKWERTLILAGTCDEVCEVVCLNPECLAP